MILEAGRWLGTGSILEAGRSLGRHLECEVLIEADESAYLVRGSWQEEGEVTTEFAGRLAQNDTGTWTLGLRAGALGLAGTAKLESQPNLGLVWNDAGTLHVAITLFPIQVGIGCRGFLREGDRVRTWEIAFRRLEQAVGGQNVVSLAARRRR